MAQTRKTDDWGSMKRSPHERIHERLRFLSALLRYFRQIREFSYCKWHNGRTLFIIEEGTVQCKLEKLDLVTGNTAGQDGDTLVVR